MVPLGFFSGFVTGFVVGFKGFVSTPGAIGVVPVGFLLEGALPDILLFPNK
jgi:hypothetical protein